MQGKCIKLRWYIGPFKLLLKRKKDRVMKRIFVFLIISLGSLGLLTGCNSQSQDLLISENSSALEATNDKQSSSKSQCVYICGQVTNPGVYQVEEGARIYEVVDLAGGFKKKAATDSVNLAEEVTDGEMIVIPSKASEEEEQAHQEEVSDGKVNINTAEMEELMTLSGIGQAKAQAIISYRQENGSFHSVEDLVNVSGIAQGTLDKIKENIKVN